MTAPDSRTVCQFTGNIAPIGKLELSDASAELAVVAQERDAALLKVDELQGRLIAAAEEIRALRLTIADLQKQRVGR